MLGKHLLYQLRQEDVTVSYAIDQQKELNHGDIAVYSLSDELPHVDAIIVTVLYDYSRIRAVLAEHRSADAEKIWALDEVLRMASGRENFEKKRNSFI